MRVSEGWGTVINHLYLDKSYVYIWDYKNLLNPSQGSSIGITKLVESVLRIAGWHHEACRVGPKDHGVA